MKPSTQITLLAACCSLALAGPAAAGPLGGHSSQGEPLIGKVNKAAHKVGLNIAYDQRCGDGDALSWMPLRAAKLTKKGTFSAKVSSREPFDDGYAVNETYTVSGKVAKGAVSGTFKVHDTWYAPDGTVDDNCDTGKVKFRIRDAGVLAGKTSDGAPTVLELGPGGSRIDSLLIPWTSECKSGDWVWNTADVSGPLDPAGAFTASLDPPSFDYGDGKRALPTEKLSGQITKSGASGSWQVETKIVDAAGLQVDTCDTGALTFRLT